MTERERIFIDSNVLVYAYDLHEPRKKNIARDVLRQGMANDNIVLSAQVLGEFFVVTTRRIQAPLTPGEALDIIETLSAIAVVEIDYLLVSKAIGVHQEYGISYRDALIVAAAQRAGCRTLLTEDMADAQAYNGLVVKNPFA